VVIDLALVLTGALIVFPLGLWLYGRYFSYRAMDEMAKRLPEKVNKEVRSSLWVEYKVGIPKVFWWRMGFQAKPFQSEPFEPHEDIYDEVKLNEFTERRFSSH